MRNACSGRAGNARCTVSSKSKASSAYVTSPAVHCRHLAKRVMSTASCRSLQKLRKQHLALFRNGCCLLKKGGGGEPCVELHPV